MGKSRIQSTDTPMDAVIKLSEGNPDAATVLTEIFISGGKIDPDDFLGGLGSILSLDTHSVYGCKIWMFYKEVCRENLVDMLGVLRAVQLGYLAESALKAAIENHGEGIDVSALVEMVKKRLPRFGTSA